MTPSGRAPPNALVGRVRWGSRSQDAPQNKMRVNIGLCLASCGYCVGTAVLLIVLRVYLYGIAAACILN